MARLVIAGVVALLVGCTSLAAPTPARPTIDTPDPVPITPAVPSLDIEQPGRTASTGQTDTDWGPIWNELPPGFPVPRGAQPTKPGDRTVSGAWTVPASALPSPIAVARFFERRFSAAGYGGGLDGPLPEGSASAWASDGYGCDILVEVVPRGDDASLATVLYGAGCPFNWLADG